MKKYKKAGSIVGNILGIILTIILMINIHWAFGVALFIYVYELLNTIFHYKEEKNY